MKSIILSTAWILSATSLLSQEAEAFNIEIDNQSMEKMLTIKAALEIINTKLAEKKWLETIL